MQLADKVVIVTGAARGIGRSIAEAFAQRGARVAMLDLGDSIEAAARECSAAARGYRCDVTREEDVIAAMDKVVADFGQLDLLVNNAGLTKDALLLKSVGGKVIGKMSLAQWQSVIDVNLTGTFLCGREAAVRMVERGTGGVIINISSVSRAGNAGQSNYSAAKAGVAALTVVWAKELARHGIRVGSIAPGFTHTPMVAAMKPEALQKMVAEIPLKRCAEPAEIAAAALFIAENDYFTGQTISVDGGIRI